ncbi:hypothetical protein, conserved [Eimeria acervulina]|uniref:Uncharacterized protein n=1 Tax=Eimeria acervulina TaxID=5801 RepID=U6GBD8_EIMAC|nr:hypothetical protein, conserved [Eimeria acervulina]CDI76638.1 hypothetical protein, conserved [Eimeria acervulina]
MLQANKAHVIAAFTRQNLNLRQMELQYWMDVLKKFATLASFLGGFASTVVQLQKGILGGPEIFQLIFSLTAAGALGLNFIVVVICTTCTVWGPGKALTGQGEESYKVHLKTLKLKFVPTKFNSGEMRGNPIKNIAGLMTRGSDLSLSGLHLDPEFCNKI